MERATDFNKFDSSEHETTVADSVKFYLQQLRQLNTGRESRKEYISELKDIFESGLYKFKLSVSQRESVAFAEMIGQELDELTIVSMNDVSPSRRGDLVFEDKRRGYYKLPVPSLPEEFEIHIQTI